MAEQQAINWLEFQQRFSSEEDCRNHLYKIRWPDGFRCPMCNHKRAYKITKRNLFECAECGYQVSVTAGTVMHKTRTPLVI
ncbi:MAG: transposase, partial [Dethiobacter sp.]|nr:transposase [Dethiobacter sp.]